MRSEISGMSKLIPYKFKIYVSYKRRANTVRPYILLLTYYFNLPLR